MRYLYSPVVLLMITLLVAPAIAQHEPIHWHQDLESAKSMAKASNRLVLVHFWAPSCGPCLALDQNVFNQPGIASAIEARFVPVKLNADENSATAQAFGVTRIPMDVIITPEGEKVGQMVSPPTPGAYISEMTQIASRYLGRSGQAFAAAAAAAPMQPQINAAYAGLKVGANTPPTLGGLPANVNANRSPFAAPAATVPTIGSNQPLANTTGQAGPLAPFTGLSPIPNASVTPPLGAPSPGLPAYPPVGAQPNPSQSFAANNASTVPQTVTNSAAGYPSNVMAQAPMTPAGQPGRPLATPSQVSNPYLAQTAAGATAVPTTPAPLMPVVPGVPAGGATVPLAAAPGAVPGYASAANAPSPVAAIPGIPDPTKLPAGSPPLGFEGYCPVSMRNSWKWVSGDPRWGIVHRSRTYWFAGPEEQKQFWTDPDRYTPALSGMDAVLALDHQQQIPGKREHSLDYDGIFYMFASEATLQQFTANPQRYAAGVRQAMGIPRGRLVR